MYRSILAAIYNRCRLQNPSSWFEEEKHDRGDRLQFHGVDTDRGDAIVACCGEPHCAIPAAWNDCCCNVFLNRVLLSTSPRAIDNWRFVSCCSSPELTSYTGIKTRGGAQSYRRADNLAPCWAKAMTMKRVGWLAFSGVENLIPST